jgi:hypothetical protein
MPETISILSILGSSQSLSAVEAIVAKYLAPKQAATIAKKRLIKRPYGVSVTDLDVFTENVLKKKKTTAAARRKNPAEDDGGEKKRRKG